MSKTVIETVKELLPADQLKLFEDAVEKLVNTQVAEKVSSLLVLKEEELQNKYETLSEGYITKEIEKREKVIQASIIESYDKKLQALEDKISLKIETYIETSINEQISDEVLEQIAINDTLKPVVEGIKKVFEANHLVLESNASEKVAKLEEKLTESSKKVSELINKNVVLESHMEKLANHILISEKTKNLSTSDTQKILESFNNRKFADTKKNIDGYIAILNEGKRVAKPVTKPKMDTMLTETEEVVVEKAKVVNTATPEIEDVASLYFEQFNTF